MYRILQTIGLVTADVHPHLARLAIEGNDSAGAGSTTTMDDEEKTEDEAQTADDDLPVDEGDDDQPRSTRAKDIAAFRELQSTNDRLKHDLDTQKRDSQDLRDRLTKIEGERTTRSEVNARTNAHLDLVKTRAREVVAEIRKLDKDAPDYSERVYETMLGKIYADQAATSAEISRRTSNEVVREERTAEQRQADAKVETLAALKEAGLSEDHFDMVQDLAIAKGVRDEGWFTRTKPEDQIPELVKTLKERLMTTTRGSQGFRDDKKRHREAMEGVIGEGSRGTRARTTDDGEAAEGPGSMLADLARLRKTQQRNTNIMLRQMER